MLTAWASSHGPGNPFDFTSTDEGQGRADLFLGCWLSPFPNGWEEADVRVAAPLKDVDVFFTAPDDALSELHTNRFATQAPVSTLPGGGSSSHSPSLAVFDDRQYTAMKGSTDSRIYIKSRARGG